MFLISDFVFNFSYNISALFIICDICEKTELKVICNVPLLKFGPVKYIFYYLTDCKIVENH